MSYVAEPPVYSVEQCNELVNQVLAAEIGPILVEGEITGLQIKRGQWVTFDLKDSASVINCFASVYKVGRSFTNGMLVRVLARPRIYVPYGKYSLSVEAVKPVGAGALQQAYELLYAQLEREGLFQAVHKQAIPPYPESIGLITSPEGAALDDVRTVVVGRWGGVHLYLHPVHVQGKNAVPEIIAAVQFFNERTSVDTIILTRGGGSMEDLQAFNDERVARTIFASRIPLICAIGHERDTTIAELVADQRAATPSHAAQLAVPARDAVQQQLIRHYAQMTERVRERILRNRHQLTSLTQRLELPIQHLLHQARQLFARYAHAAVSVRHTVAHAAQQTVQLQHRLSDVASGRLAAAKSRATSAASLLTALNPAAIVARGYSFTTDEQSGRVIRTVDAVRQGQRLSTHVADGVIASEVHHASEKAI